MPFKIKISIHALREESDLGELIHWLHYHLFLSTLSARRATCMPWQIWR